MKEELRKTEKIDKDLKRYLGYSLSKAQLVMYRPEEGDTVEDLDATWPVQQHRTYELAAKNLVAANSIAIAKDLDVAQATREAREAIFGNIAPRFNTLDEAHAWIKSEEESDYGQKVKNLGLDWVFNAELGGLVGWLSANPMLDTVKEEFPYCPYFQMKGISVEWVALRFNYTAFRPVDTDETEEYMRYAASQGQDEIAAQFERLHRREEKLNKRTESMLDQPHWGTDAAWYGWRLNDESTVIAVTPDLALTAVWGTYLCLQTQGSWSQGQAVAYILTGEVPQLPRARLWTRSLPGGGKKCTLELFGKINRREMEWLYEKIQGHTSQKGMKEATQRDLELIEFVVERGGVGKSFQEMTDEWNRAGKKPEYKRRESFWKAYDRARKRLNLAGLDAGGIVDNP